MAQSIPTRFAPLLRHILAKELGRKFIDVAHELAMEPRNFYSRINGRAGFSPEEINQVLRVVPDPRLVDCLLAFTPLTCTPRVEPAPRDPAATRIEIASRAVEQSIEVLRDAMHLGTPLGRSVEALTLINQHIREAQRQLGALQMSLVGDAARTAQAGETGPAEPAPRQPENCPSGSARLQLGERTLLPC